MSVSVSIIKKKEVEIYDANITYNLADMYYKAIDNELGLRKLDNIKCCEAVEILSKAIEDMVNNKKEYEKMNPANGWGSYDGLLNKLREMLEVCEKNPDGYFRID